MYAALLGVVQGLTEFLPVSSSAHLILARAFLGWDADRFGLAFDVACHVGTLAAVLIYFRHDIAAMLGASGRAVTGGGGPYGRLARLLVIGTVPIVIVGGLFGDVIEQRLRTPGVAAAALAAGAVALLVAERLGSRTRDVDSVGSIEAFAIGCAQAAALVPGVSRSGATILVGLLLGLRRDAAARFSFLLGAPAVAAAAVKEGLKLAHEPPGGDAWLLFAVGIASSAVVGYFTIKYFIRYLAGHSLDLFSYYRLALAAIVPLWLMLS